MGSVRFIADLHLGHKHICEFSGPYRGDVKTVDEHDAWIIEQWNQVVLKNDLVMVLGDVCFDKSKLPLLKKMRGSKHLIFGNHDKFGLQEYLKYFDKVHGFTKYKGRAWLSHAPIHPAELRGKFNIHGHLHFKTMCDDRYINVSVEKLYGRPVQWCALELMMDVQKISEPARIQEVDFFHEQY